MPVAENAQHDGQRKAGLRSCDRNDEDRKDHADEALGRGVRRKRGVPDTARIQQFAEREPTRVFEELAQCPGRRNQDQARKLGFHAPQEL